MHEIAWNTTFGINVELGYVSYVDVVINCCLIALNGLMVQWK